MNSWGRFTFVHTLVAHLRRHSKNKIGGDLEMYSNVKKGEILERERERELKK